MLGLEYDFMSYAADNLNVDILNRKTIMAGRVIMRHEIKRLSEEQEYVELHMLTLWIICHCGFSPPTGHRTRNTSPAGS